MIPVTSATIRQISQADFATLGYPEGSPDPLDALILPAANAMVGMVTWGTLTAVPTAYEPLVELAIRLAVEMHASQSTADYLETLADFDLISSFSAGSYNETRRSVDDMVKMVKLLSSWPPLNAALLAAMNPDLKDDYYALLEGRTVPAFEVTEVDWTPDHFDLLYPNGDILGYPNPHRLGGSW